MRFRKPKPVVWNARPIEIDPHWYQDISARTDVEERYQQHFTVTIALNGLLVPMYRSVAQEVDYTIFDMPDPLWKYTSSSGLEGMLRSDSIWTTATTHLNDTTEFDYGRDLFLKHLDQIGSVQTNLWKDVLPVVRRRLANINRSNVFVTCFTQHGDSRTLWGLYGLEGNGYAVGFDPTRHVELRPQVLGAKVVYDPDTQERFCSGLIERGMSIISQIMEEKDIAESNRKNVATFCLRFMCDLMITAIKHPSFSDENESRFVTSTKYDPACEGSIFYTDTEGTNAPHIALKWNGKLPIKEIVIGPLHDYEAEKARLQALAESHGYFGIDFKRSNVPLKRT